jgi:hypothetical protein
MGPGVRQDDAECLVRQFACRLIQTALRAADQLPRMRAGRDAAALRHDA